jgi:signal transduction histidine kinase
MNRTRNAIVASITRAKLELDDALEDLNALPMLNPMAFGFIAHALQNYLHVSAGTVDLLRGALAEHPSEDVQTWIGSLQSLTQRMSNLVDAMRGRPHQALPQLKFEKIDLVTLVSRACEFYRRVAAKKRVEILLEKPRSPVPRVRADRIAVAAILDNLLSNAVKFSAPGQRVWVELQPEPARMVCRVRDEGPGIKAKDRARLLRPLQQLRNGAAPEEPIDDYGLAVTAQLVANLGGEIQCESAPGAGSCFSFRLPFSSDSAADAQGAVRKSHVK